MDSILQEETARLWEYLWSVAPEKSLFEPFLLENDAHNAKAILKGTLSQRKTEHLLLAPSTLPPAVLRAAVEERKFTEAAGLPAGSPAPSSGLTACWRTTGTLNWPTRRSTGRRWPKCWLPPDGQGIRSSPAS